MLVPLAARSLPALTTLSPPTLSSSLPALTTLSSPTLSSSTLLATVLDADGARVVGAVDAPGWLLPLAAACTLLVPLLLVVASKQGAPSSTSGFASRVGGGAIDPVLARAKRFNDIRRRKRRERLMARMAVIVLGTKKKGKGLFAQRPIPAGAYLFDYEGERLDKAGYNARYPDRVSDYAVGIKSSDGAISFVDAANPLKSGLARFMNHDGDRPNVARKTLFDGPMPRVVMYTTRHVEAGEELQWDYGPGYWAAKPGQLQK